MNKKATAIRIVAVVVVLVALAVGIWLLLRGCTPSDNATPPPATTTATAPPDETNLPTTSITAGSDTDEQPSTTTKTPETTQTLATTTPPETTDSPITTEPPTTSEATVTTKTPITTKAPETTKAPVTEAPHTHSYSAWTTTKEATCTEDGKQTRSCECGVSETKAVNATGHSYGAWTQTKAPTCTTNGVKAQTCSSCKHVKEEAVAATGHAWDNGKTTVTPTTCSDMGIKTYTCTVCKTTRIEQVKGNHSFGDWQWEATTCTIKWTNGIITRDIEVDTHKKFHTCSKCKYKEYASFTPHECHENALNVGDFSTDTIVRKATCTTREVRRCICNVCGWSFEREWGSTAAHTWGGDKFIHLSDYTEYTDELDATTNTCTTCGLKSCTYILGKKSASPGQEAIYSMGTDIGTAYAGYPVNDDFALIDHPTWQTVIRNVVYDSNGYATKWDVIWWDTALNKRCADTVIVANVPKMFEDAGFDLSQYDINKVSFHFKYYYGKLVPARISWSG